MAEPLIICVVPVYNGERYLGETLDSILAQTHRPVKIIVVDDGSTDGTAAVAARYAVDVRYLRQPNLGEAAARNRGLSAAEGEFIAFNDADDLWHPEKLTRQMARLRQRPGIDRCFTRYKHFWMPELAEEEGRYRDHPLSHPQSAWSICTLLAQRVVFEKFGNFNESAREFENMSWFLRAAGQDTVIEVLPDVLMYRRFHPDNMTRKKKAEISGSFSSPFEGVAGLSIRAAGRFDSRNPKSKESVMPVPHDGAAKTRIPLFERLQIVTRT